MVGGASNISKDCSEKYPLLGYNAVKLVESQTDVSEEHIDSIFRVE
jgi:phosphoenolpyruvate-protein kinase (PTS system EI component)